MHINTTATGHSPQWAPCHCQSGDRCSLTVLKEEKSWIPLMVQWIRIYLSGQGTGVQSLVWEDSTCYRKTQSMSQNY